MLLSLMALLTQLSKNYDASHSAAFLRLCYFSYVMWFPFHHGIERPRVADGGKASTHGGYLQIY